MICVHQLLYVIQFHRSLAGPILLPDCGHCSTRLYISPAFDTPLYIILSVYKLIRSTSSQFHIARCVRDVHLKNRRNNYIWLRNNLQVSVGLLSFAGSNSVSSIQQLLVQRNTQQDNQRSCVGRSQQTSKFDRCRLKLVASPTCLTETKQKKKEKIFCLFIFYKREQLSRRQQTIHTGSQKKMFLFWDRRRHPTNRFQFEKDLKNFQTRQNLF